MNSYYSIFHIEGSINYFEDLEGEIRGITKRPCETKIFIIQGEIEAKINGTTFKLKSGTTFEFPENQWHGWITVVHSKIIQHIPKYDHRLEQKKTYE